MQKNIPCGTNTLLMETLERLKEIVMSHFIQSMATLLLHHLISMNTN